MYLAKLKYSAPLKDDGNVFWNLVLETDEDIHAFIAEEHKKASRAFWKMWCDTKEYLNKMDHCIPRNCAPTQVAAFKIMALAHEREVSLVEAATIQDQVMAERAMLLHKMLPGSIRINHAGGLSPLDGTIFEVVEKADCSETDMKQFIYDDTYTPEKKDKLLEFTKPILVIENDIMINEVLSSFVFGDWSTKNVEVVCRFRELMDGYSAEDIFKMFSNWIKLNTNIKVKAIYLETQFVDKKQFFDMQRMLELIMKNNPNETLFIYILCPEHARSEIKTDVENIQIKFLKPSGI